MYKALSASSTVCADASVQPVGLLLVAEPPSTMGMSAVLQLSFADEHVTVPSALWYASALGWTAVASTPYWQKLTPSELPHSSKSKRSLYVSDENDAPESDVVVNRFATSPCAV